MLQCSLKALSHALASRRKLHWCREGGKMKSVKVLNVEEGLPDGHTIDADGNLWHALADSNLVICLDPDSGGLLALKSESHLCPEHVGYGR